MYNENNNGPRTVPLGTSDKTGSPIWFYSIYFNSLLPETEKRIYPFQSLSTNIITIQLAFKSSWGGVSKAVSKSKIKCVNLSAIIQDFTTVINWVSQLYRFRKTCCLSNKSLCSSKCAMILEHSMCSSNLPGTQVRETGRELQVKKTYLLF